ncbi:hypothetical protein ScalyP_jg4647 [Parmales sp. scaly parma]|nr:hypothetical protein ScalyP_jg4647 [Parmales sp. scaly parma]
MAKSRVRLLDNLDNMFTSSNPDILTELEDVLLQADLGLVSTDAIMEEVKSFTRTLSRKLTKEDLISVIRSQIISAFASGEDEQLSNQLKFAKHGELTVFFVMGANGMGKTTSIGKLAHRLKTEGNQKVLVAACDTFRAGAYQQLKLWADRAEVDCYGPKMQQSSSNSNVVKPATVLYESLDKALRENYDTLIVDTSGRLSNNAPLTAELVKMKKIIQKKLVPEGGEEGELNLNVPHETILVIDAAQGRMALDSARKWNKDVGVSSLILTKLDGTAKGGSIVGVRQEVGIPVKLIGVGEGIEDLRDFDPRSYADGLLGIAADKVDLYDARILALEEERKKIVANIESNKRK